MFAMTVLAIMVVPVIFLGCVVVYYTLTHHRNESRIKFYPLKPYPGQDTSKSIEELNFSSILKDRSITFRFHLKDPDQKVTGKFTSENQVLGGDRRKDDLWKQTCFEVFWNYQDSKYLELNVTPEGQWNLYHFENYRNGMKVFENIQMLQMKSKRIGTNYDLEVSMNIPDMMFVDSGLKSQISATAVLLTDLGTEYWAIHHAGPRPDFHLQESFVIPLKVEL